MSKEISKFQKKRSRQLTNELLDSSSWLSFGKRISNLASLFGYESKDVKNLRKKLVKMESDTDES